jgi:hypothetical protein
VGSCGAREDGLGGRLFLYREHKHKGKRSVCEVRVSGECFGRTLLLEELLRLRVYLKLTT